MLIILSGLPGTGKTTIARELARRLGAVHLRIDTIEQALRNKGLIVIDEGYRVAYALAEDNLRLGRIVIADSVNPIQVTRDAWHEVARRAGSRHVDVEFVCSNRDEHRRRIETRQSDITGHQLPTWAEVTAREYHRWDCDHILIDTAHTTEHAAVARICSTLS